MKKETENRKKSGLLYGIAAAACVIVAISFYCKTDSMGMGTLWLILGCFNVCMAFKVRKEGKNEARDEEKKND